MSSGDDRDKWESRYQGSDTHTAPPPSLVLQRYRHLLPKRGRALDLAAGRGGNTLQLAERGFDTTAWDISPTALSQLEAFAATAGVSIHTEARDVIAMPPSPNQYDVIVVSRFLERRLCPAIAEALCPGGLLFYQTFIREKAFPESGPRNPDYLLAENELLQLFPDLIVRAYHEEGLAGDITKGIRNEALLVAQRPAL